MLTIFSCPKPFSGHINIIQRNAIRSWTLLQPRPEIMLIGNEEGMAEVCKEFGLRHIPEVGRNEYGTPLVSSIFRIGQEAANHPIMCYVNADIILMSDFMDAVENAIQLVGETAFSGVRRKEKSYFLMIGYRWNVDLDREVDFSGDWERELKSYIAKNGKLYTPSGIDYFVFPKGFLVDIPPFAVGRTMWDNWIVYNARSQRSPVIDITKITTVVHQNHDYSHHPYKEQGVRNGEEAKRNWKLAGGYANAFTLRDAQYKLTRKGIRRKLTIYRFYRFLVTSSSSHPFLEPIIKIAKIARFFYRAVVHR